MTQLSSLALFRGAHFHSPFTLIVLLLLVVGIAYILLKKDRS
jgi:hypothetical protein